MAKMYALPKNIPSYLNKYISCESSFEDSQCEKVA